MDALLSTIADYLKKPFHASEEAYHTARICLADALGCAILSLMHPECTKLLGPVIRGTIVPNGSKVPGTDYVLDPIRAAFNIGTMIRWLDYNDTWLAAEWGHPSDNIGGLLAISDYLCRAGISNLSVQDLLTAMIQAYEIQGILALENSFNRIGFDHVILVKVATAAVVTKLLKGSHKQISEAVSNAWLDAAPLRTYRHEPNTGSRKSWAAGDATSRGVQLALMTLQGEMGYPNALSAKKWGFNDVLLKGNELKIARPFGSYVIENILFKVSYPAEFHAQTAVECAIQLHPLVKDRLDEIEEIEIMTHDSALRIIDKKGPLKNPADRDHCLQYMVAIPLLFGTLKAEHYCDEVAADPRIDRLRHQMKVSEKVQYSKDYLHPDLRSIGNAITIKLRNGEKIGPVEIEYPLGHKKRREESLPLIFQKCHENFKTHYTDRHSQKLLDIFLDHATLASMNVAKFVDCFQKCPF